MTDPRFHLIELKDGYRITYSANITFPYDVYAAGAEIETNPEGGFRSYDRIASAETLWGARWQIRKHRKRVRKLKRLQGRDV